MKIEDFCKKLEGELAALGAGEERLSLAVQSLRKAFRVKPDEISILSLDDEKQVLVFVWPAKLAKSGFIPLSSSSSLAARTARDKKGFANNRFASVHHSSIFESVRLGPESDPPPLPIQKILSAPLLSSDKVSGVVQVCRKGTNTADAGEDFSQTQLTALTQIAQILARTL
ncbi:putative GAF sensor histidine kinase [Desulfuromonas soudanensis]|uniref:Putative GAF sensor histidine kinase n=1 Tax=Desulfuromonas soudanensis TaxID=1603606 RepID=A0A0M3QEQ2_9BACT|nr:GAF domain-containing protein [Desulfuromonas soudanensis]ALC14839.1 putative GAF sensor histidine kinase [Desulfuromonas soudanensis]